MLISIASFVPNGTRSDQTLPKPSVETLGYSLSRRSLRIITGSTSDCRSGLRSDHPVRSA